MNKKIKCARCRKRIKGLFIPECKCGKKFCCNSHIVPYKDHNCTYNFSIDDKKQLSKSLTTELKNENNKITKI